MSIKTGNKIGILLEKRLSPAYSADIAQRKQDRYSEIQAEVEVLVDQLIEAKRDMMITIITSILVKAATKGIRDTYKHWNKQLGTNVSPPAQLLDHTKVIAREFSVKILKSLRSYILSTIQKWIKIWFQEGETNESVLDKIKSLFQSDKYAEDQAKELAKQDESEVYQAALDYANKYAGAVKKKWITARDPFVDQICIDNEDAGILPVAHPFPSGHQHSPAHPNCRCHMIYNGVTRKSLYWSVEH